MTTGAPTLDAGPRTQWRRLSPRMLLVHPVVGLGKAIPALVGLLFAGTSSGGGSWWGLAGAGVVVVLALLRWVTTQFRITAYEIELRRGLARRVTITAPLDRVRTVDVTAHPLHRMLGLAKVVIGTGTSDRKGRDGLTLDGLDAHAAGRLRAELLHRRPTAELPQQAADPAPREAENEIARFDPRWLRYAPCTLSGAITGLALLGLGWRVVSEGHVDPDRIGPLRAIGDQLARWSLAADVVAVIAAALVFVAAASTVGYLLSFWNFRLTRHSGGTLHVTRGLLTSRATSIEARRLRGVELSEPLLLRGAGGARVLAIATGLRVGRGAERGGEMLMPPAPRERAVQVACDVLGSAPPLRAGLRRHPAAALRRRLVRAVAAALIVVACVAGLCWLASLPAWLWLAALAFPVVAVPLAVDRYRSLGHAVVDGYLVARFGTLVRRRSVLSCDGIIGVNLRGTFFQRRLGLATLTATTAAGRQRYRVYDLAPAEATALAGAALPGLLEQFRDTMPG